MRSGVLWSTQVFPEGTAVGRETPSVSSLSLQLVSGPLLFLQYLMIQTRTRAHCGPGFLLRSQTDLRQKHQSDSAQVF